MEYIDVSDQSLAAQEAEIYRFVIRATDLKDPVGRSSSIRLKVMWGQTQNLVIEWKKITQRVSVKLLFLVHRLNGKKIFI